MRHESNRDVAILTQLRGRRGHAVVRVRLGQGDQGRARDAAPTTWSSRTPSSCERPARIGSGTPTARTRSTAGRAAGGVPIQVVQNNLGHASIGTTSGYLTTERDARLAAMKGFGD